MSMSWKNKERLEKHRLYMIENGKKRKGITPNQLYVIGKCTHCSFTGTQSNITKWHDVKCKLNIENKENIIGKIEMIQCNYCNFRPNTANSNSRRNFKVYHLENCKHKLIADRAANQSWEYFNENQ